MSRPPDNPSQSPDPANQPPERIGQFKILETLGEGGFGVVYLAEQTEAVKRQVALKVIKPGMDTQQVISRFEAERQALAVMDHPNIARVFDGGVTEQGRPYFVMELVRGLPVTEYCDAHKLSIRERLELFIDVCQAVQHAHQKGVIHRDLKPSNILVGGDEKPEPKVIDFGIAKAVDRRLSEQTIQTQTGHMIGTPAYMSPEQADASGLDIDTRTDIYSLGVILYELLAGELPFEARQLQGLAALYTLMETDPPRPSVRYSSLEAELRSAIADHRHTDPGTLGKRLRGDLDWIIVKAMEKERARRYEGAHSLAADIERHLKEEPVVARPPSVGYRLQKFTRRNRVAVLAGVAVGLALIAGTTAATMGFVTATRRARIAESRELASSALYLLDSQPDKALVYAIEAVKRNESYEAKDALRRAVRVPHPLAILRGHEDDVLDAAFSPDGERVVTAGADGTARIWSVETGEEMLRLIGHKGDVTHAEFSPDGTRVLTASRDSTARLWLAQTGEELVILGTHGGHVYHAAFSPDGETVVTSSIRGKARLWQVETGAELAVLRSADWANVFHAAFSPAGDRVVTASEDHTARVWSTTTGALITLLGGFANWPFHAAFSPTGEQILTVAAAEDTTRSAVRLWSAHSGEELTALRVQETLDPTSVVGPGGVEVANKVAHAAFSPDGGRVVTASLSGAVRLWSAATGRLLHTLRGHEGAVTYVEFSSDGEHIVTASFDGSARLWSTRTGEQLAALSGHEGGLNRAVFSPDGEKIVTASDDGTARLWLANDFSMLLHHDGAVTYAAFSSEGERLVTTSSPITWSFHDGRTLSASLQDLRIQLWAVSTGRRLPALGDDGQESFDFVRFNPTGETVFTAKFTGYRDAMRLRSLETGEEIAVIHGDAFRMRTVELSPDGSLVLTASYDGTARFWSTTTGQELAALRGHVATTEAAKWSPWTPRPPPTAGDPWYRINHAAFSPDGGRVVTASGDSTARLWSVESTEELAVLRGHGGSVTYAEFSPDGKRVVTASSDDTARLWSADTGLELIVLRGHEGDVWEGLFSPDGQRVLTRSVDGSARLWSSETGEQLAVLHGQEGLIRLAKFSPDGKLVVTADRTARLWSVETGQEVEVLRGHEAGRFAVFHAEFSPDGKLVVTAGIDGTARLWFVHLDDLLEFAESQLPVTLTPEERAWMLER